jgi:hypothetical protein
LPIADYFTSQTTGDAPLGNVLGKQRKKPTPSFDDQSDFRTPGVKVKRKPFLHIVK